MAELLNYLSISYCIKNSLSKYFNRTNYTVSVFQEPYRIWKVSIEVFMHLNIPV